AEKIWYPIWDAGLTLDHSVRTLDEALAVAGEDTKAGLGLLDVRHITGDPELTARLRDAALARWRQRASHHLPMLRELTTSRWRTQGEWAFLLDGDLKEARGGLRDVRVLRGVGYAQVADAWRPPVRAAYTRPLDVRDARLAGLSTRPRPRSAPRASSSPPADAIGSSPRTWPRSRRRSASASRTPGRT